MSTFLIFPYNSANTIHDLKQENAPSWADENGSDSDFFAKIPQGSIRAESAIAKGGDK